MATSDQVSSIERILHDVPLPRFVRVDLTFERPRVENVRKTVREELSRSGILDRIGAGARIAVTAGSRGIVNYAEILAEAVASLRAAGAIPVIIPAMGSHGGATAEGQRELLAGMGITEQTVGAPIESSMEVVQVGTTVDDLPVMVDRIAAESDGVLLVNRVKPHVGFRGPYESGLYKMMAIGLGKQHGAGLCHDLGFGKMAENIRNIAEVVLSTGKIVGGVAATENAYHETARVEALLPQEMAEREPQLLEEAKRLLPVLPFDPVDVLIIEQIGKDISGTGFDTNVVGRFHTPYASGGPTVTRLVVLDLTDASHGNANGIGIADFTTERVFQKMKFEATYPNSLTSTVPISVKLPMVLPTDRLAIQAGIRTCNIRDKTKARVVRIRDTLSMGSIQISESLVAEARRLPGVQVDSTTQTLPR